MELHMNWFSVGSLCLFATTGRAFYWLLCLLASAPYILLPISYGRVNKGKLRTIESLMADNAIFAAYVKRFRKQVGPDQSAQELFRLTYHWTLYALAIVLNVVVITAGVCVSLIRGGISMGMPDTFEKLIVTVPPTLLLSFGGACSASMTCSNATGSETFIHPPYTLTGCT
jgi:hypothetical protein